MRDLMSSDQYSHRSRHRRGRWWCSWLSSIPKKLLSRKFNLYQVVLVAIVSYLAFRLIAILCLNNLDTPPE